MHRWTSARIPSIALLLVAGVAAAAQRPPTSLARANVLGSGSHVLVGGGLLAADRREGAPEHFVQAGQSFQAQTARRQTSDAGFDAVLAAVEAAQVQLVNGQPGPFKALWSHGEDVTLSGGLGGAIAKGWTQVSERLDWVATQYTGGVRTHQEVARYVGQDVAYVVLRETIRFKNPADGSAMAHELRVTQVFRREDGRWRIVHRHADSQVQKASP